MRVKVRKTPGVTGAQKNFALVSGSIWNYEDQPTNNTVGTTLSPVPREDANIEAEKGETIVFPDIDGNIAHAKIGGKRHSEGGTPLNVPDGSFVFSDYRGLLIKNKDVLKDVFNIGGGKSKTPAEVAKKYELNVYKQILADPWADPMDKKTAQLMIENNMKKLGQLALIQEGMKGFPDGIPDIAMPLFGSDIAQGQPIPQEEGMPMARYGGLPKAQDGKQKRPNVYVSPNILNSHFNPLSGDIYLNRAQAYQQDVLPHEMEHYDQWMRGDLRVNPDQLLGLENLPAELNPYLPLRRPSVVANESFEGQMPYYNRRAIDQEALGNEFLYTDPSFQFVNPGLIYDKVVNPEMYEVPWSAEGQAQDAGNRYVGPPYPYERTYKKGGPLPKAQSGISGIWDSIVKSFTDPSGNTVFGQPIGSTGHSQRKVAATSAQNKTAPQNNTVVQNKAKPAAAATTAVVNTPKANASAPAAARVMTSNENDAMHDRNVRNQLFKAKELWMNSDPNSAEEKRARQQLINLLGENPEYAKLPSMQEFFNEVNNLTSSRPTYLKDLGKDLDKRKVVAQQRQQAEADRIGLATTLPDEDEPIKRRQVESANKIYNDALLSNDPVTMREAAKLLEDGDTYDISGLSTPVGMIGKGLGYIGNAVQGFGIGLTGGFGLPTAPFYDLTDTNQPYGLSWQEKIYDMADVLQDKANKLQKRKELNTASKLSETKNIQFQKKYNAVKAAAEKVLNDPNSAPQDVARAATIYEDITNTGTYAPLLSDRPHYSPYRPNQYGFGKDEYEGVFSFKRSATNESEKNLDKYLVELTGAPVGEAPDEMETSNPYPEGNYFDSKTGKYLNGATDATAVVLKEQTKVNQVHQKLRDNGNAPYEEKIGNKYIQYIRLPNGNISALFIPKPTTDVVEGETTSDTTTTGKVKKEERKKKVEEVSDDYTTLQESLDLFNAAVPASEKKKLGGEQKIISYDPTRKFEMGGQLSKYAGGGGKHTQLIKETAIKSTDTYDVVMPNKKLDYTFGTQGFDSSKNYYTAINKTTGKQEELDLNDFINRQTDVLTNYDGGIDKWKADVTSTDKAAREKAAGWFQENYNTWRKANGLPEYFITKSGSNPYGKDKKLGIYTWSAPGIKKKAATVVENKPGDTPAPPAAPAPPTKPGEIPPQNYESGIAGTPWWNYDLVNYGNQLGNYFDIEPGALPTFMNYVPYIPDPTFLDPARAIAQQQGVVRGTQEAIMAASDPTVARANMIAASAAAAPQIANIMAQYDERNAGIANQYESSGAQMFNQAQLQNQQFEKQYRDELEVRRQQYQNALREGRTNVAKSIMQGLKNAAETSWVNATSDSYAVDPGTGQVYFKRGFDPLKGSFRSQTGSIADAYEELLNKGWSDEQARAILELQVKSKLPMNKSEAQVGGMLYNPMDLIWND